MKRITLRVPDHQHAALSRLLTLERVDRGNRYSLNDLCTRLLMVQLSHSGASLPRTGAPAPLGDGTMHILRTPPPPPVPRVPPATVENWTLREGVDAPQPERFARSSHANVPQDQRAEVEQRDAQDSGISLSPVASVPLRDRASTSGDLSLSGTGLPEDAADTQIELDAVPDTSPESEVRAPESEVK
jgi:hypothetical protein